LKHKLTLQLTIFEIFAVKWQKSVSERPKWSIRAPFLTLHLVTPKDIAAKGEKMCPDDSCTIVQKFTPI